MKLRFPSAPAVLSLLFTGLIASAQTAPAPEGGTESGAEGANKKDESEGAITKSEVPATTQPASSTVVPVSLGGLTPQQVYLKYRSIIFAAKSIQQLEPFLARERVSKMKESGSIPGLDVLSFIRSTEPKNAKLISERINGDKATLELSATDSGALGDGITAGLEGLGKGIATAFGAKPSAVQSKQPAVTTGTIKLVKQDGVWKIDEESWSTRIGPPPKPPTAQDKWAFGASQVDFPKTPASGRIHGMAFTVEKAEIEDNSILHLSQGKEFFADREFLLFLFNDKKASLENRSFVTPADSGPHCHMKWKPKADALPDTKMLFANEYGMKLQFGRKQANGLLPGYIILRVPDTQGSYVQGYFYASCK